MRRLEASDELFAYCEKHTSTPDALLNELVRETFSTRLQPQMLSGKIQGQLLHLISAMLQPHLILEIGTFTGYSALCLAKGLHKDGVLHTIEVNEEQETIIRKYFDRSPQAAQLQLHIGNALQIIPTLPSPFDLVFIDAGKNDYPDYLELVLPHTRKGGIIIADNVLWNGKVLNEKKDKTSAILHDFNQKIAADSRVEAVLLPIRDGITVMRVR
ncbi:MAG: O-methyltransferase [Bacteroidota bacterium]|jgi:predicted O-methyltransferase YrrM